MSLGGVVFVVLVGPGGPGRAPAVWRSPVVWFGEQMKSRGSVVESAAPGPVSVVRRPDQDARDLRPHPPHGGAASAYTCSKNGRCGSSPIDVAGDTGRASTSISQSQPFGSVIGRSDRASSWLPRPRAARRTPACTTGDALFARAAPRATPTPVARAERFGDGTTDARAPRRATRCSRALPLSTCVPRKPSMAGCRNVALLVGTGSATPLAPGARRQGCRNVASLVGTG